MPTVPANLSTVPAFDELAAKLVKSLDLKFLKDSVIGIDAAYYLQGLPKESLISALGGSPLALESTIITAVTGLQSAGLKLHFVFNGLDSRVGYDSVANAARAAQLNNEAFSLYENKQPGPAKQRFDFSSRPTLRAFGRP